MLVLFLLVSAIRKRKVADGDVCLLFLLCYGALQIVCDSTRYDSLFLRSNGFISIVQILGLVGMVAALTVQALATTESGQVITEGEQKSAQISNYYDELGTFLPVTLCSMFLRPPYNLQSAGSGFRPLR